MAIFSGLFPTKEQETRRRRRSSKGEADGRSERRRSRQPLEELSTDPQTLEELRNARTKYLDKSPAERRKSATVKERARRDSDAITVKNKTREPPSRGTYWRRSYDRTSRTDGNLKYSHSRTGSGRHDQRRTSSSTKPRQDEDEYVYVYEAPVREEQNRHDAEISGAGETEKQCPVKSRSLHSRGVNRSRRTKAAGLETSHQDSPESPKSTRRSSTLNASRTSPTEALPEDLRLPHRPKSIKPTRRHSEPKISSPTNSRHPLDRRSSLQPPTTDPKRQRPTPPQPPPESTKACLACMDDFPVSTVCALPCGCNYCRACLKQWQYINGDGTPIGKPPTCCDQPIPTTFAQTVLTNEERKAWDRKQRESAEKRPIYCADSTCGRWISSNHYYADAFDRKFALCARCKTKVCLKCKKKSHGGTCRKDYSTKDFLRQAEESGFKRCPSCKIMVERTEGCTHMTCRCGTHFCYRCGTAYKGPEGGTRACQCPLFDQEPNEDADGYFYEIIVIEELDEREEEEGTW